MIQQPDVKTKTDAELLQIWRDQIDYREEVIDWVKNEIAHRQLNIAAVHVDTPEDKIESEIVKQSSNACKIHGVIQGLFGLTATFLGLALLAEAVRNPRDAAFNGAFSMVFLLTGGGLLAVAAGIWKQKKWAVNVALAIWTFIAILNFVGLLYSNVPGRSLFSVALSVFQVRFLYKLRKRLSGPQTSTEPPQFEKTLPSHSPQTPA